MAKIALGLAGEGRGHATRALSLIHQMGSRHELHLFTSHDALRFLRAEEHNAPPFSLTEIPGIKFHYLRGKLSLRISISRGLGYLASLPSRARLLGKRFQALGIDLVISDFDSMSSWAARSANLPLLSLDHQHFLTTYDLSSLPGRLRRWAARMSLVVKATHTWQIATTVSAFFRPPAAAR